MSGLLALLLTPLFGAVALALLGGRPWAARLNQVVSVLTLLAAVACARLWLRDGSQLLFGGQFRLDALDTWVALLTALIGATTAFYSGPYLRFEVERTRLGSRRLRQYHSMFQMFMFTMLLALTTNNLGLLWVALEAATLSTVTLVSLYRNRSGLEAAWRYFILCGVGLALALFGTVLVYFAAEHALGADGMAALQWSELIRSGSKLQPGVIGIAFVFLLVGYGTKVGLVPLHNWLPDAHAEGPTPVSAVLSGLLLNVALVAVLRSRALAEASLGQHWPSLMLLAFGLLSLLLAGFALWQQKDVKRLFSYSSIEHMGLSCIAFGVGGPLGNLAGMLHLSGHALAKSAIFFCVGHAAQGVGSQRIDAIRGLRQSHPGLGWGLGLGMLAIVGMPPFSLFGSELLLILALLQQQPWAVPIVLAGLALAFAAIALRAQQMVFGEASAMRLPTRLALWPVFLQLGLVLLLGLCVPLGLHAWWQAALQLGS